MRLVVLAVLSLFVAGCSKKETKVDNAATRYTKGLQQDLTKAEQTADLASQATARTNAAMAETAKQME
jgi:hypothetical protein